MINSNKNYSFIAISKQPINKKSQINPSNYNIFTPNRTSHPLKKPQESLNLSYVSPNTQELSNFKSKLYKYIHHSNSQHDSKKELSQTKSKLDEKLQSRSAKQLAKHFYKITSKSFYEGMQKRKNIRQYMCQLSQDKRKRYGNKIENKSVQLLQEETAKINPMLIIRKVSNRIKETRDLKEKDIFKDRDVPIHHTQIYYFSKKSVKTEPEDSNEEKIERYNSVDEEKVPITMSRIIELREQLANRYESLKGRTQSNENSMIHPTVAIITTQQDQPSNLREREFYTQKKAKEEQARGEQKSKKKDEEEISPWNRRQHAEFEYE